MAVKKGEEHWNSNTGTIVDSMKKGGREKDSFF
jgi:hypothetical protein